MCSLSTSGTTLKHGKTMYFGVIFGELARTLCKRLKKCFQTFHQIYLKTLGVLERQNKVGHKA